MIDPRILDMASRQPYPLLFLTISGAHLYGFPSPDSDWDLRGAHLLPLRSVVGLDYARETIETSSIAEGLDVDLVTHDLRKFMRLMLKRNGYVLEQLYSPLVVHSTAAHEELKEIGKGCITRKHSGHYLGFAKTQWGLFAKGEPKRIKPLLYTYRVLLTGIHLMRTGEIEASIIRLLDAYPAPQVSELVVRKREGAEDAVLDHHDLSLHEREIQRLTAALEDAYAQSSLPSEPRGRAALEDMLIRLRMAAGPAQRVPGEAPA
ncbi:MAG: nucleotidyltransferase domain-containing protein [Acidobacteriota bacterium]